MALVSHGNGSSNFYMDGVMVTSGNYYYGGSLQQLTFNNYLTNTSTGFNFNVKIGASGLTDGVLSSAQLASMKSDLETEFGAI